jgi:hypothetical protein
MSEELIDSGQRSEKELPNSVLTLILGIASIPLCFCYGLPGIVAGIVALAISSGDVKKYRETPELYTKASHSNLKAGRICAIIGLCLSALYFLTVIGMILFIGLDAVYGNQIWDF